MKLCQGKDVLERMNYLYQASHLMALRSKNAVAASYYGNIMVGCAKKAVLRMNPDVKRTVCKSCQSPLIPGKTARVRLTSKPTKMVKWTCLTCNATKKFPTKRGHKLWAEEPEALVEFFDYTPKPKGVESLYQDEKSEGCTESTKSSALLVNSKTSTSIQTSTQNEGNSSCVEVANINFHEDDVIRLDKDSENECNMVID